MCYKTGPRSLDQFCSRERINNTTKKEVSNLKIEDLHFDLPSQPVDAKNWNLEKWRNENPMDYFKAMYILQLANHSILKAEAFKTIYQIVRLHIPDTLYKYYSLSNRVESNERKFQALLKCKIYLSDIKDFNDPFDGKGFFYNPAQLADIERLKSHGGRWIEDFNTYIKAASLTANGVQSMPMWAHYSNNHSGFCVSYDMKLNPVLSSCTFPVQYVSERLDVTSFMREQAQKVCDEIDKQISENKKEIVLDDLSVIFMALLLCNLKHISWSYEKEFRCTTAANAAGMPFLEAQPKEIYVGMQCKPAHEKRLKDIASTLSIPIYKMTFDERCETYKLNAKPI